MSETIHSLLLVGVMAGVTALLRFVPFLVFSGKRRIPPFLNYLSTVLPYAVMGMLLVYCLRSTPIAAAPHGLPELISIALVTGTYLWKRSTLLSVGAGTACYMLLVQTVFA